MNKKIKKWPNGIVVAVSIALIGGVLLLLTTQAGTFFVALEGESGTPSSEVRRVSNQPSASNSSYIEFGAKTTTPPAPNGKKCTAFLHGAGGYADFAETWGQYNSQPVTIVFPRSPQGQFWEYDGPHDFQYDPSSQTDEQSYNAVVTRIKTSLSSDGCTGPLLLVGGSNGGAAAAKIYCRGETFEGRLQGIILDDPVPDQAVLNCSRQNLKFKVYTYSDELTNEANQAGGVSYRCKDMPSQWYCENDTALSRARFEQEIGFAGVRQRQFHSCTWSAPECGFIDQAQSWGQQIDRFWRDFDNL